MFPEAKIPIENLKKIRKGMSLEGDILSYVQTLMKSMLYQNNLEQLSSLLNIFSKIATSKDMRVVGFTEKKNNNSKKMQKIYRYILVNYNNKITLDDVSEHMGMNRSSFCTFYKRESGKSFFSAIREYRINCSLFYPKRNKNVYWQKYVLQLALMIYHISIDLLKNKLGALPITIESKIIKVNKIHR